VKESEIKERVRERYGEIATRLAEIGQAASCCPPQQSCGCSAAQTEPARPSFADRLYSAEALENLPESVTGISLGCGNPTAIADLQPGEVVLDLGSGGGIDCFLAARQVGPEGSVIGLDMTTEMVKLARKNARQMGVTNVEFRYGEMEEMPLPDASVDVIISNCVINLSPDKDLVFSEAFRVLRSGGRLAVSDIVTQGPLPEAIRHDLEAWGACVAGALDERVYLDKIRQAGFIDVVVTERSAADAGQWPAAGDEQEAAGCQDGGKVGVASIRVSARKP